MGIMRLCFTLRATLRSSALLCDCHSKYSVFTYRGAVKSLARPGGNKLHSPHFMELGGSLPHSQASTTCPYPSQINSFHCPSHFWQAQLVSFLVGLRTYQHPGTYEADLYYLYIYCSTCTKPESFEDSYINLTKKDNVRGLGSCDRASWAKYEERRPTRCSN
jgi:hypothetical protein